MIESEQGVLVLISLLGGIIILAILIRAGVRYVGVPALVGFLVLGFVLRLADTYLAAFLSQDMEAILQFLATIGVILLLFRVGLESNLAGLVRQLKRASGIWAGNILFSGVLGYVTAAFILGLGQIPSLFIAVALTATSVAISVGVWQESGALKSATGQLLVDVAEMDDISAIFLMALLFAVVPILRNGTGASLVPLLGSTLGLLLLKLLGFGAVCILFSRFVERHITRFVRRIHPAPGQTLMVIGSGFIIAALAGLLGFSVAIGAFFAGLVFSRDPEGVKWDTPFEILYELFTPFFFIGIGLYIAPGTLTTALELGGVLLAVAVLGKLIGTGGPALLTTGRTESFLLSTSMVPRAEIAMVVMQTGLVLGEWAVPAEAFAAMAFVVLATAIVTPLALRAMLRRWPQREEEAVEGIAST
ncbi:MAG: cation:proton antiporter [Chloroflexota bacterium]|nr:cation:proton antiporter [Chloroflexota bacterium]